ncbi:hypothetical protein C8R43DRAFT_879672 [Mycena crocata]|nr:hypothetical protein C8R43DRAFT_879672 [Mycena crocata]
MAPPANQLHETPAQIFSEHTWLQGEDIACVAYGMQSILFVMSIRALWIGRGRKISKWTYGWLGYTSTVFLLATFYIVGLLRFTQQAFVDHRNITGGPNAYEHAMFSFPVNMLANVTLVILSYMCDCLNIWRCFVIYDGTSVPVIVLPVMMSFASLALGILWLKQIGSDWASPWDTARINYTIPYFATSLAFNVVVTILIVSRLLLHRRRINQVMGWNHGREYTSLAAIIVESTAIYTTFSLLFLVPFALRHPVSQTFLQILSPVQVVSAFLVIYRIAQGKGWPAIASSDCLIPRAAHGGKRHSIHTAANSSRDTLRGINVTLKLQPLKRARTADSGRLMRSEENC